MSSLIHSYSPIPAMTCDPNTAGFIVNHRLNLSGMMATSTEGHSSPDSSTQGWSDDEKFTRPISTPSFDQAKEHSSSNSSTQEWSSNEEFSRPVQTSRNILDLLDQAREEKSTSTDSESQPKSSCSSSSFDSQILKKTAKETSLVLSSESIPHPTLAFNIDELKQLIDPEVMNQDQLKEFLDYASSQIKRWEQIRSRFPNTNFIKSQTPVKKTNSSKCFSIYVAIIKDGGFHLYINLGKKHLLGEGSYKKVFKAVSINNAEYLALAKIRRNKNNELPAAEAAGMMLFPNCSNILQAHFITEGKTSLYSLMPLCEFGTLGKYQKNYRPFTEEEIRRIALGILTAVQYIHDRNIVHRDIKPANILLCKDSEGRLNAKLNDFGFLTDVSGDGTSCFKGTLGYIPPELLKETVSHADLKKGDDFATGHALYAVFFTKRSAPLFDALFPSDCYEPCASKIPSMLRRQKKIYSQLHAPRSKLEKAIIGLCNPDPQQRLTAAEAIAIIQ